MLRISARTERDVTTVKVAGELTSTGLSEFTTCSRQVLQQQLPERITFDLIDVTGIDSDGKRVLAELARAGVWLAYGDPVMQAVVDEVVADNRMQQNRLASGA